MAKLVWAKLDVYIDWGLAVEIVRQADVHLQL